MFLAMWQWESDWGSAHDPDSWATDRPRAQVLHADCGRATMRPDAALRRPGAALRHAGAAQEPASAGPCGRPRAVGETARNGRLAGGGLRPRRDRSDFDADCRRAAVSLPPWPRRLGAVTGAQTWRAWSATAGVRPWSRRPFAARASSRSSASNWASGIGAPARQRLANATRPWASCAPALCRIAPGLTTLARAGRRAVPMTLELLRWGNRWLAGPGRDYPCCAGPANTRCTRAGADQCGGVLQRETVRFG